MSATSRLSNSLKGASSRRILIIAAAVIAAGALWYVFGNSTPAPPPSNLPRPQINDPTVQGQTAVTPQMDEELAAADLNRAETATVVGGSSIPTVRDTSPRNLDLVAAPTITPPPTIERPAPIVIERPTVTPPPIPIAPTPVSAQQPRAEVRPLGESLAAIVPPAYPAASVEFFADMANFAPPAPVQQVPAQAAATTPSSRIQLPLPGTILYAEMLNEANSDSPGPVMAQIVQGPLAGARLIGAFAPQRDTLTITFTSLTLGTSRDGVEVNETIPIQAFAVDASNIGSGVATDVDYHLLQNIGITFATAFAQGFGEALATSGQSIVSNDSGTTIVNPALTTEQQLLVATGTAAGAAGESLNELFGNRPVTIKVRSGTGIGVFFLPTGVQ